MAEYDKGYIKALDDLLKVMKKRASDCSYFCPALFDKGYYQAYEDMLFEAKKLKDQKE